MLKCLFSKAFSKWSETNLEISDLFGAGYASSHCLVEVDNDGSF